jgi:hypothetical protein
MSIHPLLHLLCYSILLAVGQGMFKLAAKQSYGSSLVTFGALGYAFQLFSTPIFLAACLLYALSTVLWVALLNRLSTITSLSIGDRRFHSVDNRDRPIYIS